METDEGNERDQQREDESDRNEKSDTGKIFYILVEYHTLSNDCKSYHGLFDMKTYKLTLSKNRFKELIL